MPPHRTALMNKFILGCFCLCLIAGFAVSQCSRPPVMEIATARAASRTDRQAPSPEAPFRLSHRERARAQDREREESSFQREARLLIELREQAQKDAPAAWAAALAWPERNGGERNQALAEVCFGIAASDPQAAIEKARSVGLDQQPGAIEERLLQQWAAADAASALAWLLKQPAGDSRDKLVLRLTYVVAQADPVAAAKLALEEVPHGQAQDEAVMIVVSQWARKDLPAATAWVEEFSDSPLRERAAGELQAIAGRR
jgi:hypothetical protein